MPKVVEFIPKDPASLVASGSDFVSDNGEIKVTFTKDSATKANLMQFAAGASSVSWYPRSVLYIDDAGRRDIIFNANSSVGASVNRGTHARFSGHFPNVDDRWAVEAGQIKHYFSVNDEQRAPLPFLKNPRLGFAGIIEIDPTFNLVAMGSTVTARTECLGSLWVEDADGRPVFQLPKVEAWDQTGAKTDGTFIVTPLGTGQYELIMCIPNEWATQSSLVYPVVVDPTVIVSSAYDTSGNGGRKIVHLSNSWIVTCAYASSGYLYFYVSKDNGQTWSQLCNVVPSTTITAGNFAIASSGTTVYCICEYANNASYGAYVFDATTVTNTTQSVQSYIDEAQQSIGAGCSLAVDGQGNLHAAWCTKNSTYPNSFNIRYSKGTVSGTTVTWASPTQITTDNTSGTYTQSPCLIVDSANNPHIFVQHQANSSAAIYHWYMSSGSWVFATVYNGGTAGASNPCAVIDTNGKYHLVLTSYDSSNTNHIYYTNSTNGTTWSSPVIISPTSGDGYNNNNATITVDQNNNLYVFWESQINATYVSTYNVRYIKYTASSASWGSALNITTYTSSSQASKNAQSLWSQFNMNSSDAVRVIYQDTGASAVEYYSITLNSPPNAPTLNPVSNFDATQSQNFTWTFSDPDAGNTQSAFEIQFVDVSTGSTVVDSGKVASTNSIATMSANTFTNGKNYQWRVCTWDNSGAQGPYSPYSTFSTAAAPTVTVTTPASGSTVTSSSLTAQFSYSDPASNAQQSYQVQLLDSADAKVLEDSGTINGTNNAYTLQTTLANNTSYHVRARATNSKGITSAWSDVSFSTSFTQPQSPTVTTSPLSSQAKITIAMTNYASTNLVLNSGFEVVTQTATVFSDALTSYTGSTVPAPWTLQSGSFTFSASGATSGTMNSIMSAGNPNWKPIVGSDGSTKLVLTAQATFTMPASLSTGTDWMEVQLTQGGGPYQNCYRGYYNGSSFVVAKNIGGNYSGLGSVAQSITASTAYTITLLLDNTGALTAKLYQGTNTSGTLLQTLSATDTSLTGGFLIGVGGDTGVVISNASCVGPWANSWSIGGDSRVAWGLTQSAIGGKYSVSAVGVASGKQGLASQNITVTNSAQYNLSSYINTTSVGTSGAYAEVHTSGTTNATKTTTILTGTQSTNRYNCTITTTATTATVYCVTNDSGTVVFDNIQLEQGSTATPYIENESTSSPQQAPAIAYNDVYRRNTGTSAWTRIATNVNPSGTYDDYAVASGQGYDYKVTAYGNNGTQVDSTILTNQSVTFKNAGLWLHDVSNPSGSIMNLPYFVNQNSADGSTPNEVDWTPDATAMKFSGRDLPTVQFGETYDFSVTKGRIFIPDSTGQWFTLNALLLSKPTLCFRDGRGKMIFGNVLNFKCIDALGGHLIDLVLTQTAYSIAV